jgi:hypothetical protein
MALYYDGFKESPGALIVIKILKLIRPVDQFNLFKASKESENGYTQEFG